MVVSQPTGQGRIGARARDGLIGRARCGVLERRRERLDLDRAQRRLETSGCVLVVALNLRVLCITKGLDG